MIIFVEFLYFINYLISNWNIAKLLTDKKLNGTIQQLLQLAGEDRFKKKITQWARLSHFYPKLTFPIIKFLIYVY